MTIVRRHPVIATLVAIPVCIALACAALVAAWLHGTRIPFASGATWFSVEKVGQAHYNGEPTQPFFFLIVGNDSRGGPGNARGDALHLVGVNPALHKATILDIPRDTGAQIPGHGTDKINAALSEGGLRLQAETVGKLVGVNVPYAVTTDFDGFMALIDGVGGIDVNVPFAMHDSFSGANFQPGVVHMNGQQALAFCRDRHDFPIGDLQRSENQGTFMLAALAQLHARNPDATGTIGLLALLGRHVQLDGIGLSDLYHVARLGLSFDPSQVRNVRIPVTSGSGTRLSLDAGAQSLFQDFADDGVLETH
ncbi:MAG TPA: LCP family protein [Acidimicrobiia bacterium]|nr:LCP family protein [Acidimicrobiia bacterium]